MKNLFALVFIITILLSFSLLSQTVYYVSSSGGNDANNGTSTSTPWKTIDKARNAALSAGDQLLFKRDDSWFGELNVNLTATSAHRITIGAYGTGAKPIIYGDLTGATWSACAGHSGVWVTRATQYTDGTAYEIISGVWNSIPWINNADTRAACLSQVDAFHGSCWSGYFGGDSLYCKTHDGLIPQGHFFTEGNFISGSYITVRDLEFRNVWTALKSYGGDHLIWRNITVRNSMRPALFLVTGCQYCLVDSCRCDSAQYTALYDYFGSHNSFNYDTVKHVVGVGVIGNPYAGSEFCGIGFQQDTSCAAHGCVFDSLADYGVDTYLDVTDTIMNCTVSHMASGAMQVYGGGWSMHDNTITLNGSANAFVSWLVGSGTSHIYNNTITGLGTGYAQDVAGGDGSTTVTFNNNTITGTNVNGMFDDFSPASGIISVNNNFNGLGKFFSGSTTYTSLALFQSATGFEKGSTIAVTPVLPPAPLVPGCDSVKYYTLGRTAGVLSVVPTIIHDTVKVWDTVSYLYIGTSVFPDSLIVLPKGSIILTNSHNITTKKTTITFLMPKQ